MKPTQPMQKDIDNPTESFEHILIEAENERKKGTIVLGLVEEESILYFVISKRFQTCDRDLVMDRMPVREAVRTALDAGVLPLPGLRKEILRMAFEQFVKASPFGAYVRKNINAWAVGQFFKQLRAVAPTIISPQSRHPHEQGSSEKALRCTGRGSG